MATRFVCLSLVALAACSSRPPDAADAGAAPDATREADVKAPRHDEILAAITALKDRHACNRVTGCPGLVGLFQYGADLIAPAAEALTSPGRGEGHWTIALPEVLGQLGDARASAPLTRLLADKRWEIRIAAAIGLGHLGTHADEAARQELARLAALPDNEPMAGGDLGFRAALEFALMRTDPPNAHQHRLALVALIPQTAETVRNTPPPILDVLVSLVGHARLSEALPGVREALLTGNRFVVATALDVAGRLQDSGAITPILGLLEDPNPTLRKSAFKALTDITGASFDTAGEWRAWAARTQPPKGP